MEEINSNICKFKIKKFYQNGRLHRNNDLRVSPEHADLRLLP